MIKHKISLIQIVCIILKTNLQYKKIILLLLIMLIKQ